ncbi:MAG: hypothetical protein COA33_004735, partial [Fluviicola sp.]|nr:hypothetical protein [Fluviicola sp.]
MRLSIIITAISLILSGNFALAQGDGCSTATNLGSLPTPGACIAGLQDGATITANGTTVGSTADNPYVFQSTCQGVGGAMASPANDVWYSLTATGTILNISISGLPNANIAIWSGACGSLGANGCLTVNGGGNGSMVMTQASPGTVYYISVTSSDASGLTDGPFTLTIDNDIDCGACMLGGSMATSPAPINGTYDAGQVVTFCFTISGYSQQNTNWMHGMQITMGAGWTGTITGGVPAATSPSGSGVWIFSPGGIGVVNGVNWGPGFYFDSGLGGPLDGNGANNFGDNCSGAACSWTFCFNLTVGACTPGMDLGVTINTSGDGESGSWSSPACAGDAYTGFFAAGGCCPPPVMTSLPTSCPTSCDGSATADGLGALGNGLGPWNYVWEDAFGTVIFTDNNVNGTSTATGLCAGTYTVTVTDANGCASVGTIIVAAGPCPTPTFVPEPADVAVQCVVPAMTNLTWNDPCAVTGNVPGVDVSNGLTCPETITRTWTYTNPCGNSVTATQIITVNDTQNPTATAPAASSYQCIGDVPAQTVAEITDEADNCSVPVVTMLAETQAGTCPITITRQWSITDACNNSITVTQIITVDDTQNPSGTAPAAASYQCIGDVPAQAVAEITDEADNCSVPVVAMLAETQAGTCPITITRQWSITDACNNSITVTQIITVDDTQNPTATAPLAASYQCIGDVPAQTVAEITNEADNCSVPVVAMLAETQAGICPITITRQWSITDACNNSITVTQIITVDDTQSPTATAPLAASYQCIGDVPAQTVAEITNEA